ncbi:MAG TPA: 16S rRNA (cytidine(1402)-2'-O)-methyltransferase [Syntrophomonadaceae bacterium]|nr:16S rRNA (cytidine(1402)-2'-O)-methyltransferase [Syntrophomonadaceae bacterium]
MDLIVGKLYICGTPIGNMEDVSIRLLKTLRKVDLIACEDTRQTVKILNRYKIKKPLLSYHEHSDKNREDNLLQKLIEGEKIALVSDAGMPTISDPGEGLIKKVIEAGIDIEVIPGPSALTAALSISGLDTSSFIFVGFLPAKQKRRQEELQDFLDEKRTIICYESPHRLLRTLNDIELVLGQDREIVVAREMTKKFEEVIRGHVGEVIEHFTKTAPRGEICLLIGKKTSKEEVEFEQVIDEVKTLIASGIDKKEAFKMKAQEYSIKKSIIYNYFVENKD